MPNLYIIPEVHRKEVFFIHSLPQCPLKMCVHTYTTDKETYR